MCALSLNLSMRVALVKTGLITVCYKQHILSFTQDSSVMPRQDSMTLSTLMRMLRTS